MAFRPGPAFTETEVLKRYGDFMGKIMIDATILTACRVAIAMWLCFSVAAESASGERRVKPVKHSSPSHNSKKKAPAPFDLKATRYWKLLGMSKSAVIKELTGDEEEPYPMRLLVYKDYASGKRDVQDMRDSVQVVFKDDKATMIRESFTYFTNYSSHQTEWYDTNGIINPQPVVQEPKESATLDIVDGMEMNSYWDEIRSAILKNFHSASACNDLEIAFEISPDGSVDLMTVNKTSGDTAVDKQAMDAIKATKFPPFYGSHKRRSMAVSFKLKAFLTEKS